MKASLAASLGLAIAGLLLGGAAGAQAPGGGPGFGGHRPPMERAFGPQGKAGHWWNNPATVEKLKLTDVQRKQMDEILQKHRETLVDLRGNLEKAELVMEPLMRDDQPNEAKILAQIDKVAQARAELEKANARFLLALRGKLTPEQWKLLQAERANRRDDRRGWEPGGPGRGGREPGSQRPEGQGGQQMTPPPPPGPQGMAGEGPELRDPEMGNPEMGARQ
ncbi:MAG: Spy/CpxP family protein refolding chaperone [Terracidiphilus sp.]|nr:Spy/CpxP family protein refolding chaperone [Terracidiphilus sp.]MDR3776322.1 Spy/CpxP family protein refolding chaperone [Terracidiphilus sp.]